MAGLDDTVLVALVTLTATVLGVAVKGWYDNRRHARDLAARRDEGWKDLRLARCAALLDALAKARTELAEIAGSASIDGYDSEGRLVVEALPWARPGYLVTAAREVALIASHPVVAQSAAALQVGWDALTAAYHQELQSRPIAILMQEGFEVVDLPEGTERPEVTDVDEDMAMLTSLRQDWWFEARSGLRFAILEAERAEDDLREVMRHHLTDIVR